MRAERAGQVPAKGQTNPYVGPRAFEQGEGLPARDREKRELADLLIAERIVLLHSPSGAGKTSLIDAGLRPLLLKGRFRPSPPLRVNAPVPKTREVRNRYVHSLALDLIGTEVSPSGLARMPLKDVTEMAMANNDGFFVLVLDQFEEILLIDPADQENQRGVFFRELGNVLADGKVWALLSIREDYMGGLDGYLRYFPGHLSTTYRLDYLDRAAAAIAIRNPARDQGVEFAEKAVTELVKLLATATKQTPGGGEEEVPAPYVQPVQLQVVCRKLWRSVSRDQRAKGQSFQTIRIKDVHQHADIAAALRSYFAGVVNHVARETGADEKVIRRWFESELITPQGHRSQTLTGPVSGDIEPGTVLAELEDGYLIRGDSRGDSTWYEISHDRLVKSILDDNDNWMRPHLKPWQLAARDWASNEDPSRLIGGRELDEAQRQADKSEPTAKERLFLEASHRAEREAGPVTRAQRRMTLMGLVAIAQALVIAVLLVLLLLSLE